jgi:hypothetical protein
MAIINGEAGMSGEEGLGDTLKYWPTIFQILCNRRRSRLFRPPFFFPGEGLKSVLQQVFVASKADEADIPAYG